MNEPGNNSNSDSLSNKEILFKEVDILQGVINRMASNSFFMKGALITIVSGSYVVQHDTISITVFVLIAILALWILDAYFLNEERKFRDIYGWVVKHRMETQANMFEMNASVFYDTYAEYFKNKKVGRGVTSAFASKSKVLFYGGALLVKVIQLFCEICYYHSLYRDC